MADALDHWHWRNPQPNSVGFEGLAFGQSRFVGVGSGGWILSSSDGQEWSTSYAGLSIFFNQVLASDEGFLAWGYSETNGIMMTSSDGVEWSHHEAEEALRMTDACFANGIFVGVGSVQARNGGPWIALSPDGLRWTTLHLPLLPTQSLKGVVYGDGKWVAVGDGGVILTSHDALDWNASESGTAQDLKDVAFGGGQFVAIGDQEGTSVALISPDGLDWTTTLSRTRESAGSDENLDLHQIAFGGSGFVAVGGGSSALFSPDGQTWTEHPLGQEVDRGSVTYGGGRWVVGGRSVTSYGGFHAFTTTLVSSTDGMRWTNRTDGVPSVAQAGIAFGGGVYVGVGTGGRIARSTNGMNWSLVTTLGSPSDLSRVVYAGGRFLAPGRQGNNALLLVSEHGLEWTNRAPAVSGILVAAAYGKGRSVVVGGSVVLVSTNAHDWALSPSKTATNLSDVIFDGSQFVAVGRNGTIQTSPEGIEWTTRRSSTDAALRGIAYDGSRYVAVGSRTILVSTNAVDWTVGYAGEFALQSVVYGGGWFVAAGGLTAAFPDGVLLTSADGKEWSRRGLGGRVLPRCLAYDGRSFLLGGDGGAILQSDPVIDADLPILDLRWSGGVELWLTGNPGRRYRIEATDTLGTASSWTFLTEVLVETNAVLIRATPPAGVSQQFFRARLEP